MLARALIVVVILLLGGSAVATFAPAHPSDAECGNWIAPEFSKDQTKKLVDRADEVIASTEGIPGGDDIVADLVQTRTEVLFSYRVCSDALATRRVLAIGLFAAAALLPVAAVFISGARRERTSAN